MRFDSYKYFSLTPEGVAHVLETMKRIREFTRADIYNDKGLRWEMIHSKVGHEKQRLYTIRISQKFRAIVYRDSQFLRFLSLHPDQVRIINGSIRYGKY